MPFSILINRSIIEKKSDWPLVGSNGKFLFKRRDGFIPASLSLLVISDEAKRYMTILEEEIHAKFGGRLRTRVNGVLIQDEKILMIKHNMGNGKFFWNVPGGGMKFGSSSVENLEREFLEETGIEITVENFLCTFEYLKPPLHAIELYFEVRQSGGIFKMGIDPELPQDRQLITEIAFLDINKIQSIKNDEKHRLFWGIKSINDVRLWKGYFNFENNYIK